MRRRSESEMYTLILKVASMNDNVRGVGLSGSRCDLPSHRDYFQDYDISFFVKDIDLFRKEETWLDVFGKRMIMQKPEEIPLSSGEKGNRLVYLMLFEDGNRIDLSVVPLEGWRDYLLRENSVRILLDKDSTLEIVSEDINPGFLTQPPDSISYENCCNQFWWVSTYVLKGLVRGQWLYALDHLSILHHELLKMIAWEVVVTRESAVNLGKSWKYLDRFICREDMDELRRTYDMSGEKKCGEALILLMHLFRKHSHIVAQKLNLDPPVYGQKVEKYILKHLKDDR